MIYIETDINDVVIYIHYKPFSEKYGLNKTSQELLHAGHLVESIPEIDIAVLDMDKHVVYKYNRDNNTVYYEVV